MARALDISDGICAYLQGGLGNQLFILAAAWEQSQRLGCPLYVDTSRFLARDPLERRGDTARHFDMVGLELPGLVIGEESPWLANSPRRPGPARRPGSRSARLAVYRQPGFGFDPSINSIRPGTTLLGYFQSYRYFDGVADRVRELLTSMPLSAHENDFIRDAASTARITVHLRRGDYLASATNEYHGVATANYVNRALDLLADLSEGTEAMVYSDSPSLAREELTRETLRFVDDPDSLGTIATLRAMAEGTAFVMSNSSFSWWAAWLMSGRSSDRKVIAPRPWQASGESASDLLLPDWITLDAR